MNASSVNGQTRGISLDESQLAAIFGNNGTEAERQMFRATVERTGLDPFANHIMPTFRKVKDYSEGKEQRVKRMTIQIRIDGFRSIAARSGLYEGQVGPQYCGTDGVWKDVWTSNEPPVAARVGVYRRGFRAPLWGVAKWQEFVQTTQDDGGGFVANTMWRKMPTIMLGKCAEAQALRRAFPDDLSGIYIEEEMAQADNLPALAGQPVDRSTGEVALSPATESTEPESPLADVPPQVSQWIDSCKYAAQSNGAFAECIERAERKLSNYPVQRDLLIDELLRMQQEVEASNGAASEEGQPSLEGAVNA